MIEANSDSLADLAIIGELDIDSWKGIPYTVNESLVVNQVGTTKTHEIIVNGNKKVIVTEGKWLVDRANELSKQLSSVIN